MTLNSTQKFTASGLQLITILAGVFALFASGNFNAQIPAGVNHNEEEWLPVVIGNASIILDVPSSYRMLNSKEGFTYSLNNERLDLKNAYFFRSFEKDTYIALDVYNGAARTNTLMFDDIVKNTLKKGETIKGKGHTVRHAFLDSDALTVRQQYASIDGLVVILTTASRKGETPAMKHFLSSVKFSPDAKTVAARPFASLSSLTLTELKLSVMAESEDKIDPDPADGNKTQEPEEDRFRIFSHPTPGYTSSARFNKVQGEVVLKVTFGKDGFVPSIAVKRSLPKGLLRQALFSTLRVKFLPRIDNGEPVEFIRDVTYNFGLY